MTSASSLVSQTSSERKSAAPTTIEKRPAPGRPEHAEDDERSRDPERGRAVDAGDGDKSPPVRAQPPVHPGPAFAAGVKRMSSARAAQKSIPELGAAHSARSLSGCLRTNGAIPAQCQSVRRVSQRLSVSAWCSCRTTAAGTYQRSQPARIAGTARSMSSP